MLSYRLLLFERDGRRFTRAAGVSAARARRLVARTTCRRSAGGGSAATCNCASRWAYLDEGALQAARRERRDARAALMDALAARGCASRDVDLDAPADDALVRRRARLPRAHALAALVAADGGRPRRGASRRTSRAPCDEHPNWRRKLPVPVESWARDERAAAPGAAHRARRAARARAARGAAGPAASANIPRATYRLQLHGDFTFRDATALRALPRRARRQPRVLLALPARAAGQHARLRHRRPRRAQPRDRHARRTSTPSSPRCTRTAWGRSSTSCPTTWA